MRRATNAADIRNTFLLMIRQLSYFDESIVYIRQERNLLSFGKLGLMRDSIAKDTPVEEVLFCMCDEVSPQLGITGIILTYNCMYIKASNASLQVSFDKVRSIYADGSSFFVNDHEFKFSPKFRLLKELVDVVKDSIARCDFSYCPLHVEKYESENDIAEGNESEKDDFEQNIMQRNEITSENVTCNSCGAKIAVGSKFCPECGAKQNFQTVCPNCGFQNGSVFKFCPECGTKQEPEKSLETTARLQNHENHASSLDGQNNRWEESEAYAVLEKDFENLLSKTVDTYNNGKITTVLARPFLTSNIFSHLILAYSAKANGNVDALYNAYIMNFCEFSMSAEEYKKELMDQLLLATPYALLIINDIINLVAGKTGMDLSEIRLNENGLDDWYLGNLNTVLDGITAEIRKQTPFYPQLRASMDALKAKVSKYNSQNFIQRNKDAFINVGVNFARGFLGDPTVIVDGIKEFFSDGTDPDYKMYQQTVEQIMEVSEGGIEAAYSLENTFEDLYLQILTNGDFKSWLMDACKKMVDAGISVSVISECIQIKTADITWDDQEPDDSEEKFNSLDIYSDFLCCALIVRDSVAQQPMWNLGCKMLDWMVKAETYIYYPGCTDTTRDDLRGYYEELKAATQFLNDPLNEYMKKVVIDNLGHIRNEYNASSLYIISDDGNCNNEFEFKEDKLYAARDKYAPNIMISEILAYYDDTVFGKGDDGFILTKNAIYIKEFGADAQIISFDEINSIFWSEEKNWLGGTSRFLQINGVDYSCGLEEEFLNALVLGLRKIVDEYKKI